MPFEVTTHTPIEIDFTQLQLTCTNGDNDNGNNAIVKAIATGEFEPDQYHYYWNVSPLQMAPGDSTMAIGLKAHQLYSIEVRDNYGCPAWDTIRTEAYDNPEIEIYTDPDTAFIENPYVNFSFVNYLKTQFPFPIIFGIMEIATKVAPFTLSVLMTFQPRNMLPCMHMEILLTETPHTMHP